MQNTRTNIVAALAAVLMTAIVTTPISTDKTSGLSTIVAAGTPVELA